MGLLIRMFTSDQWKTRRFARSRDWKLIEDIVSFCNGSRSNKLKNRKQKLEKKEVEEKDTITMFSMLQFHSYIKIKASDTIYRQNRKKGTAA
jgi:hypothetical protein